MQQLIEAAWACLARNPDGLAHFSRRNFPPMRFRGRRNRLPMAPDFRLFDVLRRHGVPFIVIGDHAVTFHGSIRATEDTDVIWLRSPAAEEALLAELREINAA